MVALTSSLAPPHRFAQAAHPLPAAQPAALQPVPKFAGTSVRDPHRDSRPQAKPTTHHLQWRTSPHVAPPAATTAQTAAAQPQSAVHSSAALAATEPAAATEPVTAARPAVTTASAAAPSAYVAPAVHSNIDPQPVRQVQFDVPATPPASPTSPSPQPAPAPQPGLQLPPALEAPPAADRALPDFFADPFGERDAASPSAPAPSALPPQDAAGPQMLPPAQLPPLDNELPPPARPAGPLRPTQPPAPAGPVDPSPLRPVPEASPFERSPATPEQPGAGPRTDIDDFELPRRTPRVAEPVAPEEDMTLIRPVSFSCDDFRRGIASATIQTLSLDISPPFRPDVIEMDEYRRLKRQFEESQESRDWQSIDGRKLGRGRLRDLAYEKVIIETDFGTLEELPVNRLSEADMAYISSQWGLPQECLIEQPQYEGRSWVASQVTWKASNLMHKPLYFQDVNLERYGHTAGPFLQPVVSSAHFFANIAVLPYKMGVHLPSECQYALGYYRPGNCAPWITPPVPLSLRGALFQATAITGNVLLIP